MVNTSAIRIEIRKLGLGLDKREKLKLVNSYNKKDIGHIFNSPGVGWRKAIYT
jgi:hypothetical protein